MHKQPHLLHKQPHSLHKQPHSLHQPRPSSSPSLASPRPPPPHLSDINDGLGEAVKDVNPFIESDVDSVGGRFDARRRQERPLLPVSVTHHHRHPTMTIVISVIRRRRGRSAARIRTWRGGGEEEKGQVGRGEREKERWRGVEKRNLGDGV